MIFLAACGSTLLSQAGVKLEVVGEYNSTEIGNALNEGILTFTKAKIVLSDLEFERAQNCDQDEEVEIEYEGPYVVDLITRESFPSLSEIEIESTTYCKFKIKIEKLDDEDLSPDTSLDDDMEDLSVRIEGENDDGVQFVILIDDDEEYELESTSDEGFLLEQGVSKTLFLIFDLTGLFNGIDFDDLDEDSGVVEISEDSNEDAYDQIKENLKNFSSLKSDDDDDNEIDDDDDTIAD